MIILLYIFLGSLTVQCVFFFFFFGRLAGYRERKGDEAFTRHPVSVIICAKDEANNLNKNLPKILSQNYPEFEVIVVNDGSTDATLEVLNGLQLKSDKLKVVNLQINEKANGKRTALKAGVEASKYEYVLLTDADCFPVSDQWIDRMMSSFKEKTEIVLGFSPTQRTGGFLNLFICYENFQTALYYLSFSLAGIPYMGVGRNIAYRKHVLTTCKSLEGYGDLLSGDDDLLVNEMANSHNTAIMIAQEAQIYTIPKRTLPEWLHQKRRHIAAGMHYKSRDQFLLGLMNLSQVSFNLAFFLLMFYGFQMTLVLIVFTLKHTIQLLISGRIMRKLEIKGLWIFSPIADIFLTLFLITLGILSLFKQKTWK